MTLGCVIFLCVSLNLLLKTIDNFGDVKAPNSDILINSEDVYNANLTALLVDPTLQAYADQIKDFGYVSVPSYKYKTRGCTY